MFEKVMDNKQKPQESAHSAVLQHDVRS